MTEPALRIIVQTIAWRYPKVILMRSISNLLLFGAKHNSMLVSMLMKLSIDLIWLYRKYFSFSWFVISMDKLWAFLLLSIDVSEEGMKCIRKSDLTTLSCSASWWVLRIWVSIFSMNFCGTYIDEPCSCSHIYAPQIPLHCHMTSDNKEKASQVWLLIIVSAVPWNKSASQPMLNL